MPCFCAISGAENTNEINENLFAEYQGAFLDSVYINNMQMQIFGEIKALLAKNGIKFVPFKGAVLRELYPDPEARTMGDIDLLIEKGRQKQVKVLLCANGFENTVCGSGEWVYTKGGVITEIHTSLINGKIGNSTADEFFENAIQKAEFNGCEGRLLPQYHFEYILAHLAHHFGNCGAGIKMVLDLAVMLKAGGISIEAAEADFEKWGLANLQKSFLQSAKNGLATAKNANTPPKNRGFYRLARSLRQCEQKQGRGGGAHKACPRQCQRRIFGKACVAFSEL